MLDDLIKEMNQTGRVKFAIGNTLQDVLDFYQMLRETRRDSSCLEAWLGVFNLNTGFLYDLRDFTAEEGYWSFRLMWSEN